MENHLLNTLANQMVEPHQDAEKTTPYAQQQYAYHRPISNCRCVPTKVARIDI
jgi:hypothetical protein